MAQLLLDIGNSRIKAAWRVDGLLRPLPAEAHGGEPVAALQRLPRSEEAPSAVWIAQVLPRESEPALSAAVRSLWCCEARFARSEVTRNGLVSAYREPARLGVDRWLALLGAWQHSAGRAVVVADAGTALTVDLVTADGRHRGGLIAAGLITAQRAVLGATRFAVSDTVPAMENPQALLGQDTEGCVRQGALLACCGAIDRVSGLAPDGQWLITGGDAQTLLPLLSPRWQQRPLLVLEGLGVLAAEA